MVEYNDDLEFAHKLADISTEIALKYFKTKIKYEEKDNGTPVTKTDFEIEKTLIENIEKYKPNDSILGEEFGEKTKSNRKWIIDPIDGTSEFLLESDNWGTHIALEENNEIVIGLITRPSINKRWWAKKKNGSYYSKNNNINNQSPVILSKTKQISKSKITIWELKKTERVKKLQKMNIWVKPSLSNIIDLFEGKIDAFVDVIGKKWDHAPVSIIIKEAGGEFKNHQGDQKLDVGEVCYTNGKISNQIFNLLNYK